MKATRAYIASVGTTGVLIASSVLLLVVVSALVAFNGWPGNGLVSGIQSLVVNNDEPSLRLTGPQQVALDATPATAAVAAAAAPGTPAAGGPAAAAAATLGGAPATGGGGSAEERSRVGTPPASAVPPTPTEAGQPGLLPPPNVPNVTNTLGDTTQGLSGALGGTVGQLNPQLGQTVTDTGQALSDLVRGLGVTLQVQKKQP